jgi:transcriptional regulator with XRE-family HTH domain
VLRPGGCGSLAAFPKMLEQDRRRRGFTVGQVAWRLGVKPQEYRQLEAGSRYPDFETWDRICKLYGWPQTFLAPVT